MHYKHVLTGALFLLFLFILPQCSRADDHDPYKQRIISFLEAAGDKNIPVETVILKYICMPSPDMAGKEKEQHEFVDTCLHILRKQLQLQKSRKTSVVKYKDLPISQQNVRIEESMADEVYIVTLGDKTTINVILDGWRIISFISMTKGSTEEFPLLFCIPSKKQLKK